MSASTDRCGNAGREITQSHQPAKPYCCPFRLTFRVLAVHLQVPNKISGNFRDFFKIFHFFCNRQGKKRFYTYEYEISSLTPKSIMKATFRFFFSCLFGLALPLVTVSANPAEQERQAGGRMVLTINDVEYAFRWCPPGTFMMGSPTDEPGRARADYWETQRQVTLTRGFWMLETEVTQAMWESVMGNNPSRFRGAKLPVEMVSWNICQTYIHRLNNLGVAPAGYRFSLPTEAQWEYACRAGTTTAFSFGGTLTREQANFRNNQTMEVGSFPANAWGVHDMHGNVMEWCQDRLGNFPSDAAVTDPIGTTGLRHVVRSGVLNSSAASRSAWRSGYVPWELGSLVGFRLVLVRAE